MRNKIILSIVVVFVILGITLGFTLTGQSTRSDEIRVGWIGGITGEAAPIGQENLKGVELAVDEINSNGGNIKLIVQDDQYEAKESINAYRKLVDIHGVDYILVETYGGYLALAEQAERDGVLLIGSLDSSEEFSDIGENAYTIGVYDESIGYAIADYLNANGVQRVALINNLDDPFALLTTGAFKDRFDGETVDDTYSFSTNDYRGILTKISGEDHIVLIGWEETGRIVKQAHEMGIDAQIYGIDTFVSEDFKVNTGGDYEGLKFSFWEGSQNNPKFIQLVANYNIKYGKSPDNELFLVAGYDSTSVLLNALNGCGTVECTKTNLENTKNFQGAAGTITIDSDHITRSIKETMFTYSDGEVMPLE